MKIAVCVKQVRSIGDEVVLRDGQIDRDYMERGINEWDAFAIEQALQLRDGNGGGEVLVLTVGDDDADEVLRRGLAMGAQRAIRVGFEQDDVPDPIATARLLASVLQDEKPDLILCGTQSSDSANASVGSALAALLDVPWIAVVKGLEVSSSAIVVQRELEGGRLQSVEAALPALITVQSGINQPRYATLRAIKQAEKIAIEHRQATEVAPSRRIRAIVRPENTNEVQTLGSDPKAVAQKIIEIVREKIA